MIFSRTIFLLLIVVFSRPVLAYNDGVIDELIRKGLEKCYQFRWTDAEESFDVLIRRFPDDPRGYHYKSGVYLWYYLSSDFQSDFREFIKYSDIALEKGEQLLEDDPENEVINFTLGNAYSYRTLGYAKSESYLNAIWSSKKSEKHLKKVIENNPAMYDAYLGLGLYNFAAAQIPSAFKWALSLTGISGDEETGIRYIKIAAEKGILNKVEAQYYLSQLLSGVLLDYNTAGKILHNLSNKYPSNILFNYALAVIHMKEREPGKAERILKNIVKKNYSKFRQVISFSYFLLGDINFRENRYEEAVFNYTSFLKTTVGKDYTGIASFRLGLSYELNSERHKALEFYDKAGNGNPDIEDDLYGRKKSEQYRKKALTGEEIRLIRNFNLVESGRYEDGIKGLLSVIKEISSPVLKAEAYYYLSEAYYETAAMEESLKYALEGGKIKTGEEGWINAFCYYNAARISKELGDLESMKDYISLADDQDNDIYSKLIEHKLKNLER